MKAMKKLTRCLCAVALIVSTTSAFAMNSGSWDLNTTLNNGTWGENFNPTPGSAGSLLVATDGAQWNMFGFSSLGAVSAGGGVYNTTYVNGTVNLGNDVSTWGTGGTLTGMTLYNVSTFTTAVIGGVTYDYLTFSFTGTGTYGSKVVNITGSFIGNNVPAGVGGLDNYHIVLGGSAPGQGGTGFNTLKITVVPDGGSTLLLLGAALSTIGLLRRKLLA